MLMDFLSRIFTGLMEILAWIMLGVIVIGGIVIGGSLNNILIAVPIWIIGILFMVMSFGALSTIIKMAKDVSDMSNRQKE